MITIPAILESFRSLKDRTYKITFETSELNPDQLGKIGSALNFPGFLAFNKDAFQKAQLDLINEMKADYDDTTKTPSKRLRGVLFVNFEQHHKGYDSFEDFYRVEMEKIINHYKSKLD